MPEALLERGLKELYPVFALMLASEIVERRLKSRRASVLKLLPDVYGWVFFQRYEQT